MKFIKIVLGLFVVITTLMYITIFTSIGHGILLPIVEGKVKQASGIKNFQFDEFSLSADTIQTLIKVEDQQIELKGNFSLFSKDLDLEFSVDIQDLSKFNYLSTQKVRGTFFTQGTIKGKVHDLEIKGDGKVAKGDLNYDLSLIQYNPKNINLQTKDIKIEQLLFMVHQPQYLLGSFDSQTQLSSKALEEVRIKAEVVDGSVNDTLVQELFKLTLPNSDFTLNTNATINKGVGDYDVNINSSLISLISEGKIDTQSLKVDSNYDIKIKTLALLEQINGMKLNGSFNTNGTIKGDKAKMIVNGFTDIAKSETTYSVDLRNFQPQSINLILSEANIAELLYILNQPQYVAKGDLSSNIQIKELKPLDGSIVTTINNGIFDKKTIKEQFDIALPNNPTFTLTANTGLRGITATTDLVFDSFAAKISTQKTKYNLQNSVLNSDYTLLVPSLNDLYFLTNKKMRGEVKVIGDITFDKTLLATFSSKKFGGTIDGKLDDTKLTVNTKDISTLELLHMMYYPEIFTSALKLDLDYDTKSKKGQANLDMGNGKFVNTNTLKMISQVLKKDLSLEVYKIATIKSKIDDTKLDNELYFQSDNVSLTSNKFLMDTKAQTIDSAFKLAYRKYNIGIEATGSLTDPDMKVNLGKVATQKVKEEAVKAIEEKLGDKVDDNIKGILNNFFK